MQLTRRYIPHGLRSKRLEQNKDMKKVGIVDPTKVTRSALQNAASIASMVLTTESLVTDAPEPKNCNCGSQEGGMPAGMDGMY